MLTGYLSVVAFVSLYLMTAWNKDTKTNMLFKIYFSLQFFVTAFLLLQELGYIVKV